MVPNVQGVSLSHLAEVATEKIPSCSTKISTTTDKQSINSVHFDQLNIPKGLTDWNAMVRDIFYDKDIK